MNTDLQETFARLGGVVTEAMGEHDVPGVAVGVWADGEAYTAGFGVTSVENPLDVTGDTLFQIGSITKTFTGLLLMRLVEQELIDLDTPIRTYLPGFRVADEAATAQATLRHVLTHTGGWIGDLFTDTGGGEDAAARYLEEMATLEQMAPLGTVFSYNNAGFYLAGAVIEAVTGQSYEAALQELVLAPLGLEQAFLRPDVVMTYRFAVGHNRDEEDGATVARPWALPRAAYPAGGLVCDVHTLLRYARFQMGDGTAQDGTRLLAAETLRQMHAPQVAVWGERESVGLSWFIDDVDGTRALSHGGGTNGQVSLLVFVPGRGVALAIVTNGERGGRITNALHRWAFKEYLDVDVPTPEPIAAPEEALAQYAGRYTRPFTDIELKLEDGELLAHVTPKGGFPDEDSPPPPAPPPMRLALCEEDRLLVLEGPWQEAQADVIRKPDGSIGWLRVGRLHRRVED